MRLPQTPPDHWSLIPTIKQTKIDVLVQCTPTLPDGRYLHWNDLRHREPPSGLTSAEWWACIKWMRHQSRIVVDSMSLAYGQDFNFNQLATIQKALHDLDRTNITRELITALGNEDSLVEYRVRQIIEEAISSSVLEGARPTTREIARQLVREKRQPATRDERMVMNNWLAMRRILEIRDENRPLNINDVLELHRILGEDALDVTNGAGTFRKSGQSIRVEDSEGTIWHIPPPAEGLRKRIKALLRFAEGDSSYEKNTFIHPIIRAIIVHFWIGYEHPFRDGNGRIARALYYWVMLRHGYEMAEFLSISGPIDRSPKAYYMAFAHTETDGGDLTYFILHQLAVMREALAELIKHLKSRADRLKRLAQTVAGFDELNHRQRAVLQRAIRHPLDSYTLEGHAASHRVHYQTARNDFSDLIRRGYFESRRISGKGKRFYPSESFTKRLEGKKVK